MVMLKNYHKLECVYYRIHRPVNVVLTELSVSGKNKKGPARSSRPRVTLGGDGHQASVKVSCLGLGGQVSVSGLGGSCFVSRSRSRGFRFR